MGNKTLGTILKAVGIVIGAVSIILMFKWHPVLASSVVVGAVIYFIGDYIH